MFLRLRSPRPTLFGLFTCLVLLAAFAVLAVSGRMTNLIGSAHTHVAAGVIAADNHRDAPAQQYEHRQSHERGHELRHQRAIESQNHPARSHDHRFVALHQHNSDASAQWVDEAAHAASAGIDQDRENTSVNFIDLPPCCASITRMPNIQRVSAQVLQKPTAITSERIERPPMNPNL